jgi:hypothetical protein
MTLEIFRSIVPVEALQNPKEGVVVEFKAEPAVSIKI